MSTSLKLYFTLKSFNNTNINLFLNFLIKKFNNYLGYKFNIIRLPKTIKKYTVLRSPHINKKAREQFQLCSYKRLLDIYSTTSKTVDALMKLELPSGVEVEIKV